MRAVNTYGYIALVPHETRTGRALAGRAPSRRPGLSPHGAALMERLGERWEHEWLPSILPGLERLRTLDYGALSDDALLATLDDLRRDLAARWRVHGYLLLPTRPRARSTTSTGRRSARPTRPSRTSC